MLEIVFAPLTTAVPVATVLAGGAAIVTAGATL
jgi:hypothetical protein